MINEIVRRKLNEAAEQQQDQTPTDLLGKKDDTEEIDPKKQRDIAAMQKDLDHVTNDIRKIDGAISKLQEPVRKKIQELERKKAALQKKQGLLTKKVEDLKNGA